MVSLTAVSLSPPFRSRAFILASVSIGPFPIFVLTRIIDFPQRQWFFRIFVIFLVRF